MGVVPTDHGADRLAGAQLNECDHGDRRCQDSASGHASQFPRDTPAGAFLLGVRDGGDVLGLGGTEGPAFTPAGFSEGSGPGRTAAEETFHPPGPASGDQAGGDHPGERAGPPQETGPQAGEDGGGGGGEDGGQVGRELFSVRHQGKVSAPGA